MLIDGIRIVDGTVIENLNAPTGTSFPISPNNGELFYLTSGNIGLYQYVTSDWVMIPQVLDNLADVTVSGAAKGDLLVHNGTVWVDVTVGANNYVLTADSAEATGVKWAAASGGGSSGFEQNFLLMGA